MTNEQLELLLREYWIQVTAIDNELTGANDASVKRLVRQLREHLKYAILRLQSSDRA